MILLLPLLLAAADAGAPRPPPWNMGGAVFFEEQPFDPVFEFMGKAPRTFTFGDGRVVITDEHQVGEFALAAAPDAGLPAITVREIEVTVYGHHTGSDNDDDRPARVASWVWLDDDRARANLDGAAEVLTRKTHQAESDAFVAKLIGTVLRPGAYATEDGALGFTVGADGAATWTSSKRGTFSACYLSCSAKERWNVCLSSDAEQWAFVEEAGKIVGRLVSGATDFDCGAMRVDAGRVIRGPAKGFMTKPPLVKWPAGMKPNDLIASADEARGARLLAVIQRGQTHVRSECGAASTVIAHDAKGVTARNEDTGEDVRFVLRGGALVSEANPDCRELRASIGTGRWQER